ncbi:MAG: hypothetical protein ABXS93_05815 [Sulfurimonas sp.]
MGIIELIKEKVAKSPDNRTYRFLLNTISSTPIIGGVFSGISGIWAEKDQEKTNALFIERIDNYDKRIVAIENTLVLKDNQSHVIAGFIKFNPNTANIIDSNSISSLCDNGTLNFIINFNVPIDKYIFNFYGNGPLGLDSAIETSSGLRVTFSEPCPNLVTIVFYEI